MAVTYHREYVIGRARFEVDIRVVRQGLESLSDSEFISLDALHDPWWRAPLESELWSVLQARGIQRVLSATQSFLGVSATRVCEKHGIRNFPGFYFERLTAPLDESVRSTLRGLRDVMYAVPERSVRRTPDKPLGYFMSQIHASVLRCYWPAGFQYRDLILPPHVDAVQFGQPRITKRRDRPRIIISGRIEAEKNWEFLRRCIQAMEWVDWWIAGDGAPRAL